MMKSFKDYKYPAINPSLLAADKSRLLEETSMAYECGAPFIHIDIMDGHFVSNVSFPLEVMDELSPEDKIFKDVHIMVEKPWEVGPEFAKKGADNVTFHLEACKDEEEVFLTISKIREAGSQVGISIKPLTPVKDVIKYLPYVDLVLLMSVEPGKGGQSFIYESLERLDELKHEISLLENKPILEIDGGINETTGRESIAHGVELLVAGSYLFGHEDIKERMEKILS